MTIVVQIDPHNPQHSLIERAADVIRGGGLVAFPTETVYGLGADGLSAGAVAGIFEAKGRPASDPLILHLAAADQVSLATLDDGSADTALVRMLAASCWPGPLTLVLPRGPQVPSAVTAGGPGVALRVPAHPVALALLRASGTLIAAPSANLFGRPSPTSAADVLEDLDGRIDLILDGGPTSIGIESSVLSLLTVPPTLLRPGGLPLERIEELIGVVLLPGEAEEQVGRALPAPGMLLRHYSPRAQLLYIWGSHASDAPDWQPLLLALRREALAALARGERLGLLLCDESLQHLDDLPCERASLGSRHNLGAVAARLFAAMRTLDRAGVDAILTHSYGPTGLGRALHDRLFRAAEGKVISV